MASFVSVDPRKLMEEEAPEQAVVFDMQDFAEEKCPFIRSECKICFGPYLHPLCGFQVHLHEGDVENPSAMKSMSKPETRELLGLLMKKSYIIKPFNNDSKDEKTENSSLDENIARILHMDLPTLYGCVIDTPQDKVMDPNRCLHQFCSDCLSTYLTKKIEDGAVIPWLLRCPDPGCSYQFNPLAIRLLVSLNTYQKYVNYLEMRYIDRHPHKRHCPAENCKGIIDPGVRRSKIRVTCPECVQDWCYQCGQEWHTIHLCGGADFRMTSWAYFRNLQSCPTCGMEVEKVEGCSSVKCAYCHENFCWNCVTPFKDHNSALCPINSIVKSNHGIWGPDPVTRTVTKSTAIVVGGVAVAGGIVLQAAACITMFALGIVFVPAAIAYYSITGKPYPMVGCYIRRFPPPEVIEALSNKPVLIYVSTLNEASSKERTSQDLGVSEKKDEEKRFLLQLNSSQNFADQLVEQGICTKGNKDLANVGNPINDFQEEKAGSCLQEDCIIRGYYHKDEFRNQQIPSEWTYLVADGDSALPQTVAQRLSVVSSKRHQDAPIEENFQEDIHLWNILCMDPATNCADALQALFELYSTCPNAQPIILFSPNLASDAESNEKDNGDDGWKVNSRIQQMIHAGWNSTEKIEFSEWNESAKIISRWIIRQHFDNARSLFQSINFPCINIDETMKEHPKDAILHNQGNILKNFLRKYLEAFRYDQGFPRNLSYLQQFFRLEENKDTKMIELVYVLLCDSQHKPLLKRAIAGDVSSAIEFINVLKTEEIEMHMAELIELCVVFPPSLQVLMKHDDVIARELEEEDL